MALTENEKKLKNELIDFIENWSNNHPLLSSYPQTSNILGEFVTDLQNEISNKLSFLPPYSSKALILYSGKDISGDYLWQDNLIPHFCNTNPEYYYISSTEAGKILWEPDFQDAIVSAIGDNSVAERILSGKNFMTGKRIDQYAIEGTNILALDDFISKTLTDVAIKTGNNVVYIAGKDVKVEDKKVGLLTELPYYISERWIGKTVDEALNANLTIVDNLQKVNSPDTKEYSDVYLRNTKFYLNDCNLICGVELILDDFPTISIYDTSSSIVVYGEKLGLLSDDMIIDKYSLPHDSNTSLLNTFREYDYILKSGAVPAKITSLGIMTSYYNSCPNILDTNNKNSIKTQDTQLSKVVKNQSNQTKKTRRYMER